MTRSTRKRPHGCKPTLDFYEMINGSWMASTEIPPTETRITQAYFVQKTINRELAACVRDGPLRDMLNSWRRDEGRPIPDGLTPLLQTALAPGDVSERMGWMNRIGIACPLSIYVQGASHDHAQCRVFIEEGSPAIGIPEFWTWDTYTERRKAYRIYVKRLAAILKLPAIEAGYEAERDVAHVYPSESDGKKYTWSALQTTFPGINWVSMLRAWGLRDPNTVRFHVTSPAYIHHLARRIQSWSPARWSGWLGLLVAQWIAGCCPHGPLRAAWFAYNRRFSQGMEEDDSVVDLRHSMLRTLMPNTLGALWVRDHCSASLRTQIRIMVDHIRDAAIRRVETTGWMAKGTRAAAVEKLRRMDVQLCWPDDWAPEKVTSTVFIENFVSLASQATDRNIALLLSGGCRNPIQKGWGRPVYEVNAYYYPDENKFVLPAAILRPPYYDPAKSVPWNYGAIGATIGHELCHAFDADGRYHDAAGDKRSWWGTKDDREYKRRARRVKALYESRQYRGMDVDGSLTLTENIADLGGLEFALAGAAAALRRPLTNAELREFFTSFAVSWRAKDRKRRAAELLMTDVHAPPRLRVNHAVRQMDEWYAAFNPSTDCEDYIPPGRRIRFFH